MDEKLNLIGTLRTYCKANGIYFIPGPTAYQNAVMDCHIYENNELILVADLQFSPEFSDNFLESVTYNGTIALGRKRETDGEQYTESSLDETFEQKYDRRLQELSSLLSGLLLNLQCEHDYTLDSATISYALNEYDLNCDFVSADIQITI